MEITSAAIVAIARITAIIRKSKHSNCNDRKDRSDRACPAILPIPAIIWKSIISDRNDRMETEGELYFRKGSEKFHYAFTFRCRNYLLGANVPPEIISSDALVDMEMFARINFMKQGKLLSMIPQTKIDHTLPSGDQSLKTFPKMITRSVKL